jgi:hypothetical protein
MRTRWWKTPLYAYLGLRAMLADARILRWKNDPGRPPGKDDDS